MATTAREDLIPRMSSGDGNRSEGPSGEDGDSRTAYDPREELEEPFDPEARPRGRNGNGRYPGDDDRSQASHDDEDQEDPPTDGRQLLGWAAKQVPDAKGRVIAVGKKRG